MRNNKQTLLTKNTSTTPDETITYMELSDEDAIRVVGCGAGEMIARIEREIARTERRIAEEIRRAG